MVVLVNSTLEELNVSERGTFIPVPARKNADKN